MTECCKTIEIVIVKRIEYFAKIEYCTTNECYIITKRRTSYDDVINYYNDCWIACEWINIDWLII